MVPAATGWKTTWLVWSHIPICVPSGLHISWPGVLQELEPVPVLEPEELFPGLLGAVADGAAGVEGAAVVRIVAVGADGAVEPPSLKTPPVPDGAPDGVGVEADGADAVTGEAAAEADGEAPEDPEEPELPDEDDPAAQLPTGATSGFEPANWTESPGSGNLRSVESAVLQPLPTLATNIAGNDEARLEKPGADLALGISGSETSRLLAPVTVTGAQFMYISRFPIRLNQVHANVYWPGVIPSGTENSNLVALEPSGFSGKLPAVLAGHPPSME